MPSVSVRPPVLVGAVVSPIRSTSGRNSNRPTRSVSSDELDPAQHRRALLDLAGQLDTRLRTDAQAAAGLTITIRYADGATTPRTLRRLGYLALRNLRPTPLSASAGPLPRTCPTASALRTTVPGSHTRTPEDRELRPAQGQRVPVSAGL